MRTTLLTLAVAMSVGCSVRGAEDGLVACWRFGEGRGDVLHDTSGHANHGRIVGARWVRHGAAHALGFDGKDDFVDCGGGASLDLRSRVSILAWVWPEPPAQAGEPGIVGKAYSSYVITQYGEQAWTYISGGGNNAKAKLAPGGWRHLASTYDGQALRLYIDGDLSATRELSVPVKPGGHFWMATSDGELRYTRNAHFRGQITDVWVYNRALTPEEVRRHMDATNLSGVVAVSPVPVPTQGRLLLELDGRGLGEQARDAAVRVELMRKDGRVLHATEVGEFGRKHKAMASIPMAGRVSGLYQVRVSAQGASNTADVAWTTPPVFPRGPKRARQLNNLVTELLCVTGPGEPGRGYRFTNPRRGWIWISNLGAAEVRLSGRGGGRDQRIALDRRFEGAHETMRLLPAGEYAISSPRPVGLTVRTVPEIVFARYDSNPHVKPFGPYVGEFHRKYIFPNVNTFVGRADEPFAREWKRGGGKWLVRCSVPKSTAAKPLTADAARQFIAGHKAFRPPFVDGLIADEFGGSTPDCAVWAAAIDRALGSHADKSYYPYANDLWNGPEGRQLVAALVKHGSSIAWKRYLKEQRTEPEAWRFLNDRLVHSAQQYRALCPGSIPRLIVCFGYFSAPPEQLDTFPHVNYKTYLDMQFSLVANHPAFEGVGGVMSYLASYADEETVRWMAKLFRHYAIEGKTEPLSADPYILTHLDNGDFEQEGRGWELSPAEPGSIRFGVRRGFGWLQGRYPRTKEGDTAIILKRSARRPNVFAQTIRGLEPGRLYSFRMYSADFRDMSRKEEHAVTVALEGVELLPDQCFIHVFANCYSHHHGPYGRHNKAWMNYHWRVFRAKGETAKLRVSDWRGPNGPGGEVGQELMFNFVQVQPYDAP